MTQHPTPSPTPVPRWAKVLATGALGLLGLTILLIIVANVFAPEPAPAPKAADAPVVPLVAKADPAIRGVADSPGYFVVDMKPEVWTEGETLFSVGSAVQSIGRALQLGAADGGSAPTVVVTVNTDLIDRLGGRSERITLSLFFDRTDLEAANFDNLSVGRTLNLATDIRFDRYGAESLAAYCSSERGREQSRPFCALAASKVPS